METMFSMLCSASSQGGTVGSAAPVRKTLPMTFSSDRYFVISTLYGTEAPSIGIAVVKISASEFDIYHSSTTLTKLYIAVGS